MIGRRKERECWILRKFMYAVVMVVVVFPGPPQLLLHSPSLLPAAASLPHSSLFLGLVTHDAAVPPASLASFLPIPHSARRHPQPLSPGEAAEGKHICRRGVTRTPCAAACRRRRCSAGVLLREVIRRGGVGQVWVSGMVSSFRYHYYTSHPHTSLCCNSPVSPGTHVCTTRLAARLAGLASCSWQSWRRDFLCLGSGVCPGAWWFRPREGEVS